MTTLKIINGNHRLEVDFDYDHGEPQTREHPGEPASLEVLEIRDLVKRGRSPSILDNRPEVTPRWRKVKVIKGDELLGPCYDEITEHIMGLLDTVAGEAPRSEQEAKEEAEHYNELAIQNAANLAADHGIVQG